MPDHVHMLLNVPPKLAVSSVVGYIKGKSARTGVKADCFYRFKNGLISVG
jgi:putative transposase